MPQSKAGNVQYPFVKMRIIEKTVNMFYSQYNLNGARRKSRGRSRGENEGRGACRAARWLAASSFRYSFVDFGGRRTCGTSSSALFHKN